MVVNEPTYNIYIYIYIYIAILQENQHTCNHTKIILVSGAVENSLRLRFSVKKNSVAVYRKFDNKKIKAKNEKQNISLY